MSFILDALKKSEAERQRQSGPTLLEVRVTPPRRRYPLWALIVGALLALNAVVLMVFLLRRPSAGAPDQVATTPAAPVVSAAPPPAAAVPVPAPVTAPVAPPAPAAAPAASAPVAAAPAAAATASDVEADNPADELPAVPRGQVTRNDKDYNTLPNSSDFGNLPDLRLDLHVYADRMSDRYALINMHKVHEGDTLPEGPKVLAITRDGVALDYRGQDFMLRPQ